MEAKKLPGIFEIIKRSFVIYFAKGNFLYFLKIALLNLGITLGLVVPIIVTSGFFSKEPIVQQIGPAVTVFIPTIVLILAMVLWGLLMQATVVVAVSSVVAGKGLGIKKTIKVAWGKLGRFFVTNLASSLIILVGFIFLIIPGLIFMVWYQFSQYLIITREIRPIEAIRESKRLVSGYFWPVVGRLLGITLFFIIFQVALGFIRVLGPLLIALMTPYYVLVPYLLFDSLRKVKE